MPTIAFAFLCPRSAVRARHCQTGQWAVGSDLETGSEKATLIGTLERQEKSPRYKTQRPPTTRPSCYHISYDYLMKPNLSITLKLFQIVTIQEALEIECKIVFIYG